MTPMLNPRTSSKRRIETGVPACSYPFVLITSILLLAILSINVTAQVIKDPPVPQKTVSQPETETASKGLVTDWAVMGRLGAPADRATQEGQLTPVGFTELEAVKKIPIMGGTIYSVVFKNTGDLETNDVFGTGFKDFDDSFREGLGYKRNMSPRLDRKAKYLYLYQVVNDRGFDPRNRLKKPREVNFAIDDEIKKIPPTQDIARFAVRLTANPQYITSWGYFDDHAFVSRVVDMDLVGNPQRDADAKAISFLPAILSRHREAKYQPNGSGQSITTLLPGFRIDRSTKGIGQSKAFEDLMKVKDDIRFVNTIRPLGDPKGAKGAVVPSYIQIMYDPREERISGDTQAEKEVTRAMFVVDFDWQNAKALKQGQHSVVFGLTSDLPPSSDKVRIDTKEALVKNRGIGFSNYFSESEFKRLDVDPRNEEQGGILPEREPHVQAKAMGGMHMISFRPAEAIPVMALLQPAPDAALFSMGSGFPAPTAAAGPGGFAPLAGGGAGGGGGLGGGAGAGGGGIGFPTFAGGFSPLIGGGSGAAGGGAGSGGAGNDADATAATRNIVNFDTTLSNQQEQNQKQSQGQHQCQGGHGHQHQGGGPGHVVPAPASLLLGVLGLPVLYFLCRRKSVDVTSGKAPSAKA